MAGLFIESAMGCNGSDGVSDRGSCIERDSGWIERGTPLSFDARCPGRSRSNLCHRILRPVQQALHFFHMNSVVA